MDNETWKALVGSAHAAYTAAMREGGVGKPTLMPFVGGHLVGIVYLRPVYPGKDAGTAIVEMSALAAAARADEVVVSWETQDIASACELPPLHPGSALNMVWASRTRHAVYRFPYRERLLPGRTPAGLHRVAPDWLPAAPAVPDGQLEPAIKGLIEYCFTPLDRTLPDPVDAADAWLTAEGYTVRRTHRRTT